MKTPRLVFFLARFVFAFFILFTSGYCLLTFIPFTYQQFHVGDLLLWLTVFVKYHPFISLAALAIVTPTLLESRPDRVTQNAVTGFLAVYLLAGVALVFHPLLINLRNDVMSLVWCVVSLTPLLWIGVIDWLEHRDLVAWEGSDSDEDYRTFRAGWQTALFVSAVYAGGVFVRFGMSKTAPFSTMEWLLGFAWSLLTHLVFFMGIFLVLHAFRSLASMLVRPKRTDFILSIALSVALIWLIIRFLIFPTVSFGGYPASFVAFMLALSVVFLSAGTALRLYQPQQGPVESGIALLFTPMRFARFYSPLGKIAYIVILAVIAYALEARFALMDWNYVLQRLVALAIWAIAFAGFYEMSYQGRNRRSHIFFYVVAGCAVILYTVLLRLEPGIEVRVHDVPTEVSRALDEYAGYDASFKVAHEMLTPNEGGSGEDSFYGFLAQNTNIPRSVHVDPVDIKLAPSLRASTLRKPNIFIFVVDSLRRDYVSAYNPAVSFTPAMGNFAKDSLVMQNAFTRYGGTGLSEPSIWVGGMVLHKQYTTPFSPMNSLQKMLEVDRYQSYLTVDPILRVIVAPSPSIIELDTNDQIATYDFCQSLTELTGKLSERNDPERPIFAYTQPQDIHISVIDRENRSVPPGESFPGFNAPYASRLKRIDGCFGGFIQYLKKSGLYANSIVILTADHGDSLGEGGRWGHAYTIFPEIVRVPLIIHLPLWMADKYSSDAKALAFLTDITPSLYYLLGHRPLMNNDLFGQALFRETGTPPATRVHDNYLLVSSYAPVYGVLSHNGHSLYIADGVSYKDYEYELLGGPAGQSRPVTDSVRTEEQQLIREEVLKIGRFYGYREP